MVGLDIEPGYVAAVEVRPGARVEVERAAAAPLEPGVVRDGEVVDAEALAEVLKSLFQEHRFSKRVRLGIANQRIVVRHIDLPPVTDPKQLETAVRFTAQDHIPMPLEQAVLDHQLVGIVDTPEGPRARVVVVAARRDMIERVLGAVRMAGLKPEGIDLSAFALIRALGEAGDSDTATLFLNVGGMTNLVVGKGSTCLFTRVVAGGIEAPATELAERRGLTLTHAHQWLRHVGLVAEMTDIEGEHDIIEAARKILVAGVQRVADAVRSTLDFYRMQEGSVPIGRAILVGAAAGIPGFAEQLSEQVGLPVEIGNVVEARPGALGGIDAGRLAVAAGLAIEERAA